VVEGKVEIPKIEPKRKKGTKGGEEEERAKNGSNCLWIMPTVCVLTFSRCETRTKISKGRGGKGGGEDTKKKIKTQSQYSRGIKTSEMECVVVTKTN